MGPLFRSPSRCALRPSAFACGRGRLPYIEYLNSIDQRVLRLREFYGPCTAPILQVPLRVPARRAQRIDRSLRYFPLPLSCGTVQVAVPVTALPARSRAVTVRR